MFNGKTYKLFSWFKKTHVIVALIVASITGFVVASLAASGITYSGHTPANGATVSVPNPSISVVASVYEGTITENDVQMLLDGSLVTPSLSVGGDPNTYNISYTPSIVLANGTHAVAVSVYDALLGVNETTNWSFKVDAAPNASNLTPTNGSKVETSPKISAYIKDTYNDLDSNSLALSIDGVSVSPSFTFKGHWEYDSCYGYYWVIDSYKEGTMEYQSSGLSDGVHNIKLSMADVNGYKMIREWNFTLGTKPSFSNLSPANNAELTSVNRVSAKVADVGNNLDPSTIALKINGNQVIHQYDTVNSIVYFDQIFSYGTHNVEISASDTQGNTGSTSWSFIVDNQPPSASLTGNFTNGMTITSGQLDFKATLNDICDIKNNAKLYLNGQPLNSTFTYKGHWEHDYYGSYYVIDSYKEAYVTYKGTVADGSHTLTLYTEDELGNQKDYSWTFTVAIPPSITDPSPTIYGITDLTPTISATAKDPNGTIAHTDLKINGISVPHNYDPAVYKVTYTPAENLADEQYYNVSLTATDEAGFNTTKTWKFYINTYPDMPDSNYTNCTACHTGVSGPNPLEGDNDYHRNLSFYGDHGTQGDQCQDCHAYISVGAGCSQCHSGDGYPYAPHGSTPTINYGPTNYDTSFPIRILDNREMFDCIICHQPGSGVLAYEGAYSNPTRLINNHDIPELHKTGRSDCNKCHAVSLTREHTRTGRFNDNRISVNCNTCHKSSKTEVKGAIAGKNKDCAACHTVAAHDSLDTSKLLHGSGLSVDCQTCHRKDIDDEHVNNLRTKTTTGSNYSCEVCHGSAQATVQDAVYFKNKDCTACHVANYHDLAALHNSIYTDPKKVDCSTCHVSRLDTEHQGRVSSTTGQTINCGTCHNSTRADVQSALNTKNTRCDACHTIHNDVSGVHSSDYTATPIVNCTQCHYGTLVEQESQGHMKIKVPGTVQVNSCNTCHSSTNPVVTDAVYNNNKRCDACHTVHTAVSTEVYHTTVDYVYNKTFDCSGCHNQVISTEHQARGCNLCHDPYNQQFTELNLAQKVSDAVYNQQINCDACHYIHSDVSAAHDSGYVTQPIVNCAQCHNDILDIEHQARGFNCATCHDSTNQTVSGAIYNNNNKCDACHSTHTAASTSVYHTTADYVANKTFDCSSCHNKNLTTEHQPRGDCNLCHDAYNQQFTDPDLAQKVTDAVYGKQINCDSCHSIHQDVSSAHKTTLSYGCNLCHSTSLTANHGENCATCHSSTQENVKKAIAENNTSCSACHAIHPDTSHESGFVINKTLDCSGCHNKNLITEHENNNRLCETCHRTDNNKVNYAVNTQNRYCDACHSVHEDIKTPHTTTFPKVVPVNCASCHNQVISDEHNKADSNGKQMTCNTCHGATVSQEIKNAIRDEKTTCTACHAVIHTEKQIQQKHISNFEPKPSFTCKGCHNGVLVEEHEKANKDCNACHDSSMKQVATAIKESKKECRACHSIHVDVVRAHWEFASDKTKCQDCHRVHGAHSWEGRGE